MLLVWLQTSLEKLVCLSMMEYVGGGDSSPRDASDRFAAASRSRYKPVAPSISDVQTDQQTHAKVVATLYASEQFTNG